MIPRKDLYIGVAILAVALIGGMVLHAYIGSAIDAAKQQQLKSDVSQRIEAMHAELKDALAQIAKDKQVTQPQQIVQRLPQYVELPKPIYIQPPVTQASDVGRNSLPDAPSATPPVGALVIPPESVKDFWAHETSCKEDSLKLAECQKEIPLLEQRAEAAEKAMKGGGFFSRVRRQAKTIVFTAIVTGATVCATGHCK